MSTAVLRAYLIDDPILQLLRRQPASSLVEADCDRIVGAIRAKIAHLPPTAEIPALITTRDTRQTLRRVVRDEFPRHTVLTYNELAPDVAVQPVAWIRCDAAPAEARVPV